LVNPEVDKNKKNEKQNKLLTIFLTTFLLTFVFVLFVVKNFPEIDVEISKNAEQEQEENTEIGSVDERLKWIQFEDNMPGVSTRYTTTDNANQDEESQNQDNIIEYDDDLKTNKNSLNSLKSKEEAVIKVEPIVQMPENVPSVNKISKVYVGQFATKEQAITMQNRLMDAGLDLAPFVKKVGSNYVIQIGSYASAQKAQSIAETVQNAGFSARVVSE